MKYTIYITYKVSNSLNFCLLNNYFTVVLKKNITYIHLHNYKILLINTMKLLKYLYYNIIIQSFNLKYNIVGV